MAAQERKLPEGFIPDKPSVPEGFIPDSVEPEPITELEGIEFDPTPITAPEGESGGFFSRIFDPLIDRNTLDARSIEGNKEPEDYWSGFARSIFDDVVEGSTSPFAIGTAIAGGPIARGALKVARKIPGASAVEGFLNKPLFGTGKAAAPVAEEAVESVAPTVTGPQSIIDDFVNNNTPQGPQQKMIPRNDGTVAPITNPTARVEPTTNTPLPGPIDKLITAATNARRLEGEQAAIYTAERAKKIAEVGGVKTTGQKGFFERKGKLAGEHTKVTMEPLQLDQIDVDSLFDDINVAGLDAFQKINASTGLQKILSGQVPQKSELALISKVFGEDKVSALTSALPKVDVAKSNIHEAYNVARGMQTIYDLSFPFRQGLPKIHTKAWRDSWVPMFKSLGDEKAYRGIMDGIMDHPNFKAKVLADGSKQEPLFSRAGLKLTDLTDATSREEEAISTWVERFIPGARASNRAYTAFANKLRSDEFNRLIDNAAKAGKNPEENIDLARQIAGMINNTTGRGSLGAFERHAVGANNILFSPRFIASRLQMVNPKNYIKTDPMVRKEYVKSMLALSGAWLASNELAKQAGAEVGDDPNSTDFGKAKFGETRLDPGAGFQQWLVLASRLSNGEYATTTGNTREFGQGFGTNTKYDAMIDFVTNKLHPTLGFGARALGASEYRPFELGDETMKLFTPMIIQDMSDILQDDPKLLPLAIPALVGYGVQTQGERGQNFRLFGNELPDVGLTGNEGIGRMFGGGNQFNQRIRP